MGRKKRKSEAKVKTALERISPALWLGLAVGVLAFLLYLPSLSSGFVYDSEVQVQDDDYIHTRSNLVDVVTFRVLGKDVLDGNRPVQLFFLMVDSLFWKRNPMGYHLTSNALHALNAALLFLLIVQLLRPASGTRAVYIAALAGALLFAFHPVNVEAVAEISSREDLLATFFVLIGLHLAIRYGDSQGRAIWLAGCLAASLLAAASKETGMMMPFILLAYWLLYRGNEAGRRWGALTGSVFLLVVLFAVARFALQPRDSFIFLHPPEYLDGSFAGVFLVQPRIWFFYLRSIGWPTNLSADYVAQNVAWIQLWWALCVLVIFVGLQGLLGWKSRVAAFGAILFWLALAPVSNFMPIFRPVADRYLYLPMGGFALMTGGLLFAFLRRRSVFMALSALFALILIVLATLTWKRQAVFANPLNLWTDSVTKSPFSSTATNNLGYALFAKGDYPNALTQFERALRISAWKNSNAWAGVAISFEKMGRPTRAELALREAIAREKIYDDPKAVVRSMLMSPEDAVILGRIRARMPKNEEESLQTP